MFLMIHRIDLHTFAAILVASSCFCSAFSKCVHPSTILERSAGVYFDSRSVFWISRNRFFGRFFGSFFLAHFCRHFPVVQVGFMCHDFTMGIVVDGPGSILLPVLLLQRDPGFHIVHGLIGHYLLSHFSVRNICAICAFFLSEGFMFCDLQWSKTCSPMELINLLCVLSF
jgi:hypothetical protein